MIGRVQLLALLLFATAVAGIWAYQTLYAAPSQACERSGNWWDAASRTCGHVVYLPDITHRRPSVARASYPTLPKSPDAGAAGASR